MMVLQGLSDNSNNNNNNSLNNDDKGAKSKTDKRNFNKKDKKGEYKNNHNGVADEPPSLADDGDADSGNGNGNDNGNATNDTDEQDGEGPSPPPPAMSPGERSSAGPLLFPGSSLYDALVAMEQYNSRVAEADAHRWRMASSMVQVAARKNDHDGGSGSNTSASSSTNTTGATTNGGVLPTIQARTRSNYIRAERRERALMDSQQYLAEAESLLRARKDESRKLWSRMNKIENEINRKVEEKLRQRSRDRELKRRQEENERHAALSDGKLQSTVTQQEIWVSFFLYSNLICLHFQYRSCREFAN